MMRIDHDDDNDGNYNSESVNMKAYITILFI